MSALSSVQFIVFSVVLLAAAGVRADDPVYYGHGSGHYYGEAPGEPSNKPSDHKDDYLIDEDKLRAAQQQAAEQQRADQQAQAAKDQQVLDQSIDNFVKQSFGTPASPQPQTPTQIQQTNDAYRKWANAQKAALDAARPATKEKSIFDDAGDATRRNLTGDNSFNAKGAADTIDEYAADDYTGNCATAVRKALEFGGRIKSFNKVRVELGIVDPKDYGDLLTDERIGFASVDFDPEVDTPELGDVAVFQDTIDDDGNVKHPHGHIEMFDGHRWVSDTKQYGAFSGFFASKDYKAADDFKVYRHE